jgi:hypothetical protein
MSHFCLAGNSDVMVSAVSAAGSAQATAYVWGGVNGDPHGKPVELWSQTDQVRIQANENYPPSPPGYIFSYTIPNRYIGLTFIGVQPGTTILESENKIRVGSDSPSAAKARTEKYAAMIIPAGAAGRPASIAADLWARLLNFSKRYEGGTDFMYNDKGNPQLVTCGVGKMFPNAAEAAKHKRYFVNLEGNEPSVDEMTADFDAAHEFKRTEKNLYDFATVTLLRLPPDKITELLGSFMGDKVRAMLGMAAFANFASFPPDAKLACASIAYGGWGYGSFAPLRDAIMARDWYRAANVYKSPGWDAQKDAAHVALFRSAAAVSR